MYSYSPGRLGGAALPLPLVMLLSLAACKTGVTAPADPGVAARKAPLRSDGVIAFSSHFQGSSEIYTVRPDGSAYSRVTNHPDHDAHPAWDGSQRLVFMREPPFSSDVDLYFINPNGSGEAPVSPGQLIDVWTEMMPAVSPDGSKIAFASGGDVWVMNSSGAGRVKLTSWGGLDDGPTWSPDGSRIAFSSDRTGHGDIYTIKLNGTDLKQVTATDQQEHTPAWSR